MSFTVSKLAKMQNRVEFVIGYRNLVNLIIIFFAATYLTLQGDYAEGFIVGAFMFIIGLTRFYDQVVRNIDDLECQDLLDKKEA
jgi:hypothetical protein